MLWISIFDCTKITLVMYLVCIFFLPFLNVNVSIIVVFIVLLICIGKQIIDKHISHSFSCHCAYSYLFYFCLFFLSWMSDLFPFMKFFFKKEKKKVFILNGNYCTVLLGFFLVLYNKLLFFPFLFFSYLQ